MTTNANEAVQPKELPPWMNRQGITSTSAASGSQQSGTPLMQVAAAETASNGADGVEAFDAKADEDRINVRHLQQWVCF